MATSLDRDVKPTFSFVKRQSSSRTMGLSVGGVSLDRLALFSLYAGAGAAVSAAYRDAVAPEVYDAVLGAVLTAIKRLDLRYTYGTPEEGGRCVTDYCCGDIRSRSCFCGFSLLPSRDMNHRPPGFRRVFPRERRVVHNPNPSSTKPEPCFVVNIF